MMSYGLFSNERPFCIGHLPFVQLFRLTNRSAGLASFFAFVHQRFVPSSFSDFGAEDIPPDARARQAAVALDLRDDHAGTLLQHAPLPAPT